jgi:dTDP-glucose pyrophosphorylase
MGDPKDSCVTLGQSLREAITRIDRNCKGIVLVVDGDQRLLGTLTDGDVRRALLRGMHLDAPVDSLVAEKASGPYPQPITARVGTSHAERLQLMQTHHVHQLPILDHDGRVADLVILDDLMPEQIVPLQAMIMAGGKGTRLHPITENVPKALLPVGDRPIMEHIVDQLRDAGIHRINVATHHLADQIKNHFGDGRDFGVELNYVSEERPLGTAGALGMLQLDDQPVLVINGDVLTRINFRAMRDFHRQNKADLTVAVREYDIQVPYGVIDCDGERVTGLREKPLYQFFVNAGIYLLEPSVFRFIPNGERMDMTEFMQDLLARSCRVVSFPVHEYWIDIGQHADYARAREDINTQLVAS